MDISFLLNLILTFVVGSLWVSLATLLAERFGTRIGGWLAGLPSIVVVTLLFIAITQTADAAVHATSSIPLSMCFSGLFMVTYAFLAPTSFILAIVAAFLVWLIPAVVTAVLHWANFEMSVLIFVVALVAWTYLLGKMNLSTAGHARMRYTRAQIIGRAIFSGLIMVSAVVLSRAAGPILGGSFSAFPGVFASTLIITYHSRGLEFSRAITKPLMISGMVSVVIYATAVRYLYPPAGIALGTVLAYAVSMVGAYPTYLYINRGQ